MQTTPKDKSKTLARVARPRRTAVLRTLPLCLLLCVGTATRALSQQPANTATSAGSPLRERIEAIITQANLSPQIGLSIVDVETGRAIVALKGDLPLNPASNLKLLTTASTLMVLGPDFRMQTGLYGRVRQGRTEGGLCLKGQADPTLTRADFAEFAQRLHDRGVREIDRIVVDGSYFDAAILPPAFDQQPNETAPFRAAVGAVSVNANAYTLRIGPGSGLGAPARVTVDGAGYFELNNHVTTSASPTPKVAISERDLGEKVSITLNGTVPQSGATLALPRRVAAPLYYAGYVLIEALQTAGLQAPATVQLDTCPADAPLLARRQSQPLAEVLARLGKNSDNFVAEMLVKILGAEHEHKPGTTAAGIEVIRDTLRSLGLPLDRLTMVNGSGLFTGNLVTTKLISRLLVAMYRNPAYRPEFVGQLSVGGDDGTLARRFTQLRPRRVVRAKTGTLNDVIALSGYVLGPVPGRAYAFSYLANGIKGKQRQARALIDKVVEVLAGDLYTGSSIAGAGQAR